MKTLLFVILVIKETLEACGTGCLRCTPSDVCLACENWASYYLDQGSCVRKTLKSCQLLSQTGDCAMCAPAYFYDFSVKACSPVPTEFAIEHCELYNSDLTCKYCSSGYFINGGKCSPVSQEIKNCLYYGAAAACETCAAGYAVSLTGDSCISTEGIDSNCSTFVPFKCRGCLGSHIMNQNYYILQALNSTTTSVGYILNDFLKRATGTPTPTCALRNIDNCVSYADYYTCDKCADGYFLNPPNKCIAYPKPTLDGCALYISDSICGDCKQGFYLSRPTECTPVTPIVDCVTYATNSSSTQCTECKPESYLGISGTCVARYLSLNVTNCTSKSLTDDICTACVAGYQPTTDGQLCLASPANCNETATSSYSSNQITCSKCSPLYYLNTATQQCSLGSIDNCYIYDQYNNSCVQCKNKYYLENGVCNLHSDITGCVEYDGLSKNSCKACNSTSLMFVKNKVCLAVTPILGCVAYSSTTTCSSCEDGYKLSGTTCSAIPAETNCLRVTAANACIKCKPKYTLNSGSCTPMFAFLATNCAEDNLSSGDVSLTNALCTSCNSGSYPFSYLNYYVCMENSLIQLWTSKTFSNCRQIQYKSSTYSCRKCAYGFFQTTALDCLSSCPVGYAVNLHLFAASGNGYAYSSEFTCTADATCKLKALNNHVYSADVAIGCALCNDGYVGVVNPNSDISIQMNSYDFAKNIIVPAAPVIFLPSPSCISASNVISLNAVTLVDNCEYYYTYSGKTGCLKCKHGYAGSLYDASDGSGFIRTCSQMTSCDSSINYPGLSKMISSILSCHKCVELSKIPFIFVRAGTSAYSDNIALKSYSLDAATPKSATSGGVTVDCLASGTMVSSYTLSSLPSNCAVGLINIEADSKNLSQAAQSTSVDRSKIAAFCVACIPAYKPLKASDNATPAVTVKHMVAGCTLIPNCKLSTWFNYCSQCQDTYIYGYTLATGVQYDNCVQYTADLFCFAADISNPLSYTCVYCRKGYMKNPDGVCVKRIPPKCKEDRFIAKQTFPRIDFNTMLYLQPEGEGCNECEDGFTPVQLTSDKLVCTVSSYVAANVFPANTAFIPNCKKYSIDSSNNVICTQCRTDYIIDTTKKICYSATDLKSCAEAYAFDTCNSCVDGYIVVSGICQLKNVRNCKTYSNSRSNTAQFCSECDDGYYLSLPNCLPGSIPKCKTYGSGPDKCTACLAGYQLVYNSLQKPYCYPIDPSLGCAKLNTLDLEQGVFTCTECSSNLFAQATPPAADVKSLCLPFQSIDNCLSYNVSQQIGFSNFQCTQCNQDFYSKGPSCEKRTKAVDGCVVYAPLGELCQSCGNQTYLSLDASRCVAYPSGIDGCRLYANLTTCLGCKANFYFNFTENKCMVVDSAKIVENCLYYNRYSKCETCQSGFALSVNKTCEAMVAKNCLTAANKTACATCPPGNGLQNESGVLNCVAITDVNCVNYELLYPFRCNECKSGFALSDAGVCQAVPTQIKGCVSYDSPTTCQRCGQGLVLVNKLACKSGSDLDKIRDANCADAYIDAGLQCATCKGGYWFRNGTCVSCNIAGCHLCDPSTPGACSICQAGYYMDKSNLCNVAHYDLSTSNNTNSTLSAALASLNVLVVLWLWRL